MENERSTLSVGPVLCPQYFRRFSQLFEDGLRFQTSSHDNDVGYLPEDLCQQWIGVLWTFVCILIKIGVCPVCAVSYTHLDVYKRQSLRYSSGSGLPI